MRTHLNILAVLHLILSALGLFTAVTILLATLGAGAFLGMSGQAPAGTGILVGGIGTMVSIVFAALALPGLALAWGFWKQKPWSRTLGIILGALHLLNFPFGTCLGIYTLWAMFQPETKAILDGERSFA